MPSQRNLLLGLSLAAIPASVSAERFCFWENAKTQVCWEGEVNENGQNCLMENNLCYDPVPAVKRAEAPLVPSDPMPPWGPPKAGTKRAENIVEEFLEDGLELVPTKWRLFPPYGDSAAVTKREEAPMNGVWTTIFVPTATVTARGEEAEPTTTIEILD